jgi:hypothetical protein
VVFSFKKKKKKEGEREEKKRRDFLEKRKRKKKKKSLKEVKVAQIVFGPLLAHYLYLAFAVLFQTKAYFSP